MEIVFTYEHLQVFNLKDVTECLEIYDLLCSDSTTYTEHTRICELKADVMRYLVIWFEDGNGDESTFSYIQNKITQKLAELISLGCEPSIKRLFEYGRWT